MAGQTAREIMTKGCECIGENATVREAAEKLADLNVGSMPICGEDDRLKGMLTDRDIVVKCIAKGGDPGSTRVGELASGTPIWIDADASIDDVVRTMSEHQIRRVPVIDDHRLVGIIAQADVGRKAPAEETGETVAAISEA
jgi:CBS domain-containing protein